MDKTSQIPAAHFMKCPFCHPSPSDIKFSNELCYAREDSFPVSPGHMLVIPFRHVADLFEIKDDERTAMFELLWLVRDRSLEALSPDGFNVGINAGEAAGQTVMHVHLHIIPRFKGDVADPRGGVRWIIPAKARYWPG
jgi:diadenosine tetraphosphate (Ap4A) HIT family hydrolase